MSWEKKFTRSMGSKKSVQIHTLIFVLMLSLPLFGVDLDTVLLVLTTLVSLEAIYLSLFIQMSVNENTESLLVVEENIDEIQEDVGEIQQDVDEIQEDVDEIQENVDEIQEDVDEISTDITEIESDIDEIQEEVTQDLNEKSELDGIHEMLKKLLEEVDRLKTLK